MATCDDDEPRIEIVANASSPPSLRTCTPGERRDEARGVGDLAWGAVLVVQTLIGRDGFRAGMDEYFRRHDGQAVTCEDFVAAMAAASGFDFTQFMRWYKQPGTPKLAVDGYFDAESKTYTLTCTQANPRASDDAPRRRGDAAVLPPEGPRVGAHGSPFLGAD